MQVSMHMNTGIEFYNEVFWAFQVLPMGVDKTEVRYTGYTRNDLTEQERELVDLMAPQWGTLSTENERMKSE